MNQNAGTQLRALYNYFRRNEHCFKDLKHVPTGNEMMFLLFFHQVKLNFAKFFENDTKDLQDTLILLSDKQKKELKFWPPTLENIKSKSRKEILKNIHHMSEAFIKPFLSDEQKMAIYSTKIRMGVYLNSLRCMPFSWHEYDKDKFPANPTRIPSAMCSNCIRCCARSSPVKALGS